jgi:S1-C subfamily serine protease
MNRKKIFIGGLVFIGVVFAVQGIAGNIKFAAIKPTASTALTDEQQGVLSVRTVKASVVNILGKPKVQPQSSILSVTANGQVSGTGFVVDSGGLVATNNHVVVDAALDYFVVLSDGTEYPAQVLGQDKYDDVALLKIQAAGLVAAHLGNSDNLETGQSVFAIGNSLGRYQNSVTRGVVSGLGRGINENGDGSGTPTMHNWIQTDAAINPGNSGGPLINMAGEVIGMNTLIDTQGSALGFAVPINIVDDAINQLKSFGKVSRPYLGIQFNVIDSALVKQKNLSVSKGAYVAMVVPKTPAERGDIQPGDIIISINGQTIDQVSQLDIVVQKYKAGDQINFKLLRGDKQLERIVILGQLP